MGCSYYWTWPGECGDYDSSNPLYALKANSMCCACGGGTDTSSLAAYRPTKDVEMRILYNSTSSNLADEHGRVAIDYFTLQVVEECYNFGIAPTAMSGIDDFIYKVGDKTPATYTCVDTNTGGEVDSGGQDCTNYNAGTRTCGNFDAALNSAAMCCGCGGGIYKTVLEAGFTLTGDTGSNDCAIAWDV